MNIVDTPGHADFGGEVERVLKMVDSVLLLVDAFEGPMPQTRFVTRKALALGLRPILVVNKIDRVGCDPDGAVNDTFDPSAHSAPTKSSSTFPVIYASGREGLAVRQPDRRAQGSRAAARPHRRGRAAARRRCRRAARHARGELDYDDYLGYVAIGRMLSGRVRQGDRVLCVHRDSSAKNSAWPESSATSPSSASSCPRPWRATSAPCTGMQARPSAETITDIARPIVLPLLEIEEPTVKMQFISNNGPFAGKEGKFVTSRDLRERLFKELKSNVALRVLETESPDTYEVLGAASFTFPCSSKPCGARATSSWFPSLKSSSSKARTARSSSPTKTS